MTSVALKTPQIACTTACHFVIIPSPSLSKRFRRKILKKNPQERRRKSLLQTLKLHIINTRQPLIQFQAAGFKNRGHLLCIPADCPSCRQIPNVCF